MSSSSIAAEIRTCEAHIRTLEAEQRQLEQRHENQTQSLRAFQTQSSNFEGDVRSHETRHGNISQLTSTVKYAKKIGLRFQTLKGGRGGQISRLGNIDQTMRTEIRETLKKLLSVEDELARERQRLSSLKDAYDAACREEAAQAAREAAERAARQAREAQEAAARRK
ncbi:MAG: hypothetical protein Q4G07_02195 [Oscillospiraceae bacterium]|nr:hypothetical protein [Oscillospiraceae bacterium]